MEISELTEEQPTNQDITLDKSSLSPTNSDKIKKEEEKDTSDNNNEIDIDLEGDDEANEGEDKEESNVEEGVESKPEGNNTNFIHYKY